MVAIRVLLQSRALPHLPQLEPLDSEDRGSGALGQAVRGGAAEATQPNDDVLELPASHRG